jgi:hypothetical protein
MNLAPLLAISSPTVQRCDQPSVHTPFKKTCDLTRWPNRTLWALLRADASSTFLQQWCARLSCIRPALLPCCQHSWVGLAQWVAPLSASWRMFVVDAHEASAIDTGRRVTPLSTPLHLLRCSAYPLRFQYMSRK